MTRRPPLRLRPPVYAPSEEQVQAQIVEGLRWHGYEVLSTVHRYRRQQCARCGHSFWPLGGYGADKGIGDLLVRRPVWPWWVRIEADVKSATGRVSPEQQARVESGGLRIWRSLEDALSDLEEVEAL